jgi:hypothetical protein
VFTLLCCLTRDKENTMLHGISSVTLLSILCQIVLYLLILMRAIGPCQADYWWDRRRP